MQKYLEEIKKRMENYQNNLQTPLDMYIYADEQEHSLESLEAFGVPEMYQGACFSEDWVSDELKKKLEPWIRSPRKFLLLWGDCGVGKTYIACCILQMYRKNGRRNARFLTLSDIFMEWKDLFKKELSEINFLQKLLQPDLLVLDDLGIRAPSDGFLEFFFSLVDKRGSKCLPTIFTTNLDSQGINDMYGQRLTSRLSSGVVIKLTGADKRLEKPF